MKKNQEVTVSLVSHNGVPANWPGRIELWRHQDRYEVRGGGQVFAEGTNDFEVLLDEATMYNIEGERCPARLVCVGNEAELWKIESTDYETHELRTKDGMIYPEHSGTFQKLAPTFGFQFA